MINNLRNEIKFVVRFIDFNKTIQTFINAGLPLSKHHPDRIVNNIYFDTPEFKFFFDNISGISARKKVRLRWYGSNQNNNDYKLEIKYRQNSLGGKISQNLKLIGQNIFQVKINQLINIIKKETYNDYFKVLLNSSRPVFFNSYRRSYFYIKEQNIRVTLDFLKASKFLNGSKNIVESLNIIQPKIMIIEFKAAQDEYNKLSNYIRRLDFVRTRYSKFSSALINSNYNGYYS